MILFSHQFEWHPPSTGGGLRRILSMDVKTQKQLDIRKHVQNHLPVEVISERTNDCVSFTYFTQIKDTSDYQSRYWEDNHGVWYRTTHFDIVLRFKEV